MLPCSSTGRNSLIMPLRALSEAARSRMGILSGFLSRWEMALMLALMALPISA